MYLQLIVFLKLNRVIFNQQMSSLAELCIEKCAEEDLGSIEISDELRVYQERGLRHCEMRKLLAEVNVKQTASEIAELVERKHNTALLIYLAILGEGWIFFGNWYHSKTIGNQDKLTIEFVDRRCDWCVHICDTDCFPSWAVRRLRVEVNFNAKNADEVRFLITDYQDNKIFGNY